MRNKVTLGPNAFSFYLPYHKADRLFEGNTIVIESRDDDMDPRSIFDAYLSSRDSRFPANPALWLKDDGSIPTYSWVKNQLTSLFGNLVAGHSLRSGGATWLAERGVPDDVIQAIGRWASETFRIYIRKNPVILHALIHGRHLSPS